MGQVWSPSSCPDSRQLEQGGGVVGSRETLLCVTVDLGDTEVSGKAEPTKRQRDTHGQPHENCPGSGWGGPCYRLGLVLGQGLVGGCRALSHL